jgi:hypothetical protein
LPDEYNKHYHWTVENSIEFQTRFMQDHWNCCSARKRPHRKSHGRIAFTSLTKYIARTWKERLPDGCKQVFAVLADHDSARWRRHGSSMRGSQRYSMNCFNWPHQSCVNINCLEQTLTRFRPIAESQMSKVITIALLHLCYPEHLRD